MFGSEPAGQDDKPRRPADYHVMGGIPMSERERSTNGGKDLSFVNMDDGSACCQSTRSEATTDAHIIGPRASAPEVTVIMQSDTRVRVRFVTKDESIRVMDAPIAVPTQLGRKGLSEVVDHLRSSSGGGPYDFVIEGQMLRCSLEKFLRTTGMSTEATVTIEYFRSMTPPSEGPKSAPSDAWVGCLSLLQGHSQLAAGFYDGAVRCYRAKDRRSSTASCVAAAHDGPIKALVSCPSPSSGESSWVLTGGKDRVVKRWSVGANGIVQIEALVGHDNSIECMAVQRTDDKIQLLSGDWNGILHLWVLKDTAVGSVKGSAEDGPARKKRKDKSGAEASAPVEVFPTATIKAHAQCVSGVSWDPKAPEKVFTSSYDHSMKAWDFERRDCIRTFSGGKVVTCMAVSEGSLGLLLASGHPDERIRVWDVRTVEAAEESMSKKALAGCGSWISGVEWHPSRPFVLGSLSHDGMLRMWDIRSSRPLHEVKAHDGKGLALCLESDGERAFTGGSDGVVASWNVA